MHYLSVVLFYLFVVFGLINTVHLGLYLVGANIYDIWQYRRRSRANAEDKQDFPGVTVTIPAYNEELTIKRCLDSLLATKYPDLQVIVHNDQSPDKTADIVRKYKRQHKELDLRLVDRHQRVGKAGGLNYCIQKYAKHGLIMTLDADCVLKADAIHKTVRYFDNPKVKAVAANVRLMDERTILGVLQRFEHMVGYRSKKFYSITNCEMIVGGVASTYRKKVLEQVGYYDQNTQTEDIGLSMKLAALGNKENRTIYASDVVAMTEGVHSYKALLKQRYRWKMGCLQNLFMYTRYTLAVSSRHSLSLTMYRLPMAFLSEIMLLLQPFILGYVAWLSFYYHAPGLFFGAYLTITLYILLTIWPDEHTPAAKKIANSLYAPFLYFAFYIMDAVQVIAILRCLFNVKTVARRDKSGSQAAWTPPARTGQRVKFS